MIASLTALLAIAPLQAKAAPAGPIVPKLGLTITKSGSAKPGIYNLATNTDNVAKPALTIQGDNLVVDFKGATLRGTPASVDPDKRLGLAVLVKGKNVTIKNLNVRGYRFGILARSAPGIKILNCDLSYNWKQHLLSNLEREDGADWMSYHRNEKDEWLRYGCAIYLRKCDGFEVKGCTAVGGQNGLMMMECSDGKVWNNNFSFLSGAGVAMYLSSRNQIMHNKIDWCVRGYSHGVYNRGQDSTGILIYEQSHRNIFAYNSVTHGGDGFFLWAGQTTMDTGKGGCNDNLLYGNDFSHSPANGIEATFSRNLFINNLLLENWHGIWGGFGYESKTIGNTFGLNGEAISWEHGQDNVIQYNRFLSDASGIGLWQNATLDPNWGYGKARDCRSRDWLIADNSFEGIAGSVLRIRETSSVAVQDNEFARNGRIFELGGKREGFTFKNNDVRHRTGEEPGNGIKIQGGTWRTSGQGAQAPVRLVDGNGTESPNAPKDQPGYLALFETDWSPTDLSWMSDAGRAATSKYAPKPLQGGMNAMLPDGAIRGRRYILVDEWGPYDFKRPILWPRGEAPQTVQQAGREPAASRATAYRFEILGPKGYWKVAQSRGVGSLSKLAGTVPDMVDVVLEPGKASDIWIELEYTGAATTDVKGNVTPKGKPVKFGYRKFFAPIAWDTKWFTYDANTQEPRSQYAAFQALLKEGKPILTEKSDKLDFTDGYKGALRDHYATSAVGTVELPAGKYVLNCTSDDGVHVWIDGKLVIDRWNWHGPTLDTAELGPGKHEIRVEHFEIDGYSMLKLDIQPKK
ncbi:MAG: right-handed parallel beta-helix repeat-containing protein [Armatimonadetes bacterium]|nr:right-handed parallel beta-helix repeat-containing protein [Armatimonadota bacterium]